MVFEGVSEFMAEVGNLSFDNAYDMTVDGLIVLGLLFLASFVFSVVVSVVFKTLGERRREETEWVSISTKPEEDAETAPQPAPELTPEQKLKQKAEELRKREEAMKSERLRELSEREQYVKGRSEQQYAVDKKPEYGGDYKTDPLDDERNKIRKMLDDAERRFSAGEMTERNFRTIAEDYQRRLIDLDIRLKKKREGGF